MTCYINTVFMDGYGQLRGYCLTGKFISVYFFSFAPVVMEVHNEMDT
jgi:hypothetical protein